MNAKFLEFIDVSCALKGHRVGISSPVYYFDAMFSSFRAPDKKDQTYETKVQCSVVGCSTWHKRLLCLLLCHCAVCMGECETIMTRDNFWGRNIKTRHRSRVV